VRSRLAGLPTRVRQQIPHLTAEEVGIIDDFVREALDELALKLESEDDDDDGDGS
jgi:phage terminase Nu1 subunit (DNA packaging protein)